MQPLDMAGITAPIPAARLNQTNRQRPVFASQRLRRTSRCSATAEKTPRFVKLAVTGVTELLRLLSSSANGFDEEKDGGGNRVLVSSVDDIVAILRSDYEDAYFVTGNFTSAIYAEECIFEDPTIRFQGKELYSRNLKLLVPFFDRPVIELQTIEGGVANGRSFVLARWKLRLSDMQKAGTFLHLKPLARYSPPTLGVHMTKCKAFTVQCYMHNHSCSGDIDEHQIKSGGKKLCSDRGSNQDGT